MTIYNNNVEGKFSGIPQIPFNSGIICARGGMATTGWLRCVMILVVMVLVEVGYGGWLCFVCG